MEKKKLLLSCIITEFTDSKMVVVPYRHEDRGYTKTIVEQSSNNDRKMKNQIQIKPRHQLPQLMQVKSRKEIE